MNRNTDDIDRDHEWATVIGVVIVLVILLCYGAFGVKP